MKLVQRSYCARSALSLAAMLLAFGAVQPAVATIVTYEFQGVIGDVSSPPRPYFSWTLTDAGGSLHNEFGDLSQLAGKQISGSISFDTTVGEAENASVVPSGPYLAQYYFTPQNPTFELGGKPRPFSYNYAEVISKRHPSASSPYDTVIFVGQPLTIAGQPLPFLSHFSLWFVGVQTDIGNDLIPENLNLTDWIGTGVIENYATPLEKIPFTLTSLNGTTPPIPPSSASIPDGGATWALLALAFPALVGLRRVAK